MTNQHYCMKTIVKLVMLKLLNSTLQPFQGERKAIPRKYQGLQLHTRALQRIHVELLIERSEKDCQGGKVMHTEHNTEAGSKTLDSEQPSGEHKQVRGLFISLFVSMVNYLI